MRKLSKRAYIEATKLLASRPTVIPNTRVILNEKDRLEYYQRVNDAMEEYINIDDPHQIAAFCDAAGVPD